MLDAATLARIELRDPGIRERLAHVEMWDITYLSDRLNVTGVLVQPKGPGPYPCLIYNRGGSREDGVLTPEDTAAYLVPVARWGYLVVASNYRGNGGGEGREEFGGVDVNDVCHLIPLLEHLPRADPSRIGMWGWSRGGLMTYRALTRTDRIAAAIIVAGITDAFDYIARRPDMEQVLSELIPDYARNKHAALETRSPMRWAEHLCKRTPLLVLHGSSDWRVHPTQALRMAGVLYEHQHPFRLVFLEGGDHALTEYQAETSALYRAWLDYYVRDKRPWPNLAPHGE
jgi:dipeptidyl aminopeptidase/acylaminoacyl peptidase